MNHMIPANHDERWEKNSHEVLEQGPKANICSFKAVDASSFENYKYMVLSLLFFLMVIININNIFLSTSRNYTKSFFTTNTTTRPQRKMKDQQMATVQSLINSTECLLSRYRGFSNWLEEQIATLQHRLSEIERLRQQPHPDNGVESQQRPTLSVAGLRRLHEELLPLVEDPLEGRLYFLLGVKMMINEQITFLRESAEFLRSLKGLGNGQ